MNPEPTNKPTEDEIPQPQVIYANLSGDQEATVIESLCMNCHKQGETKLLLTKIPFFKDVIIMAFSCEECGLRNSEVQTGQIQDQGVRINARMTSKKDLNREIVKSEYCTVKIPELDFEYPPASRKAMISTVEGILQTFIDGLTQGLEERKEQDPAVCEQIEAFIQKVVKIKDGFGFPFHLIFDDPSGNSYIKNPYAPSSDPEMKVERFYASKEQFEAMGFDPSNAIEERKTIDHKDSLKQAHKILDFTKSLDEDDQLKGESLSFPTACSACKSMGENKMCTITVPYFKELIIMAFSCDNCGAKSREVKVGGAISQKAQKITFRVEKPGDLERDVFKSETSHLIIPELDLELMSGTLGGVFTTVEGLLQQISGHLKENNPFFGDSADPHFKNSMEKTIAKLEGYSKFKDNEKFTIILDDALSNCFILNPFYPKEDPQIDVETYERNFEQNEELGLNDINTDHYEQKTKEDTHKEQPKEQLSEQPKEKSEDK